MRKTGLMRKAGKRLLVMVLTLTVTGMAWGAEGDKKPLESHLANQQKEEWNLSESLNDDDLVNKHVLPITVLRGSGIADTQADGTVYELGTSKDDVSDYNRPFYLKKGEYYYFGEAKAGDKEYEYAVRSLLWEMKKVKVTNGGGNETVEKTVFKFKGITAYYRIQKIREIRNRAGISNVFFSKYMFLKVEPLNTKWAEENLLNWDTDNKVLIFSERTEKFQNRDEVFPNFRYNNHDDTWGFGCLYIAGGPGFGYGEFDKYIGWDARWQPAGAIETYVLADNQMWIPSPEKNLYKFRLQAGGNLTHTKDKGFNVKFYLNNYLKNGSGEWYNYERINSWRGNNVTDADYDNRSKEHVEPYDKDYPYLLHLDDARDCFYLSGNVPETGSDESLNSPDWDNGNFRTATIGFDSDTPAIPEGYTFEITLDLRKDYTETALTEAPAEWKNHEGVNGAKVTIEQIKDSYTLNYVNLDLTTYKDNTSLTNEDIKYVEADGTTQAEVYLSKYNKEEENKVDNPNRDVTKRIKLRDALRFDYGIPFKKQYTTNQTELGNIVKFKNLIIHGALDNDDMQYISWLAKNGKLVELDLSDAILPDGKIPGPQKIDAEDKETSFGGWVDDISTENGVLTKVTVPEDGVKGVGKNAFKDCKALTNMGDIVKAVKGAIGESAFEGCDNNNTTAIDLKGVTEIGENAFKNCKQLRKIIVPAKVEVENMTPDYSFEGYGESQPTDVGSTFKDVIVNGTTIIEAEDFNSGNNGYSHNNKSSEGEDDSYRNDTNKNYGIKKNDTFSNNHDIGYNEKGDWYCYTFKVATDGYYKLTAHIGSGDKAERKITATFDGNSDGIGFILPADQQNQDVWDGRCIREISSDKILFFKAGYHYMKIEVTGDNGIELDYYTLNYVGSGQTENNITNAKYANSFEGINPNDCEVAFTGEDVSSNWEEYRKQAGWMYLLTKTMTEDNAYDNVYQEHADAKVTRTFKTKKWTSVVFPFDITGKVLNNVTDKDGKPLTAFVKAATLYDNNFGGYENLKMRFVYLDNTNALQENGTEIISAGTPFLLYANNEIAFPSDNVYVFKDVTTYASKAGKGSETYSAEKVAEIKDPAVEKGITNWNFTGNIFWKTGDGSVSTTSDVYWVADSKYYWGTNVTMMNFRSWFKANNAQGAKEIAAIFGFMDDDATGINIVSAEEKPDYNIYNIQGQVVRKNTTSTVGLPKGIYIINGNRIIVK